MLQGLVQVIGWVLAAGLVVVTLLLAFNRRSGLTILQHRTELLPQVMLVRYGGMALLALIAAWLQAPVFLFAVLLVFAVFGLGDAFIYRRAGFPFQLHLIVGGAALICALLALFVTR